MPLDWPPRTCLRILANVYYGLPLLSGCRGKTANSLAIQECQKMGWLGLGNSLTPLGLRLLEKERAKCQRSLLSSSL